MGGTTISNSYQNTAHVELVVNYPAVLDSPVSDDDDDYEGRQCCTRRSCKILRCTDYLIVAIMSAALSALSFYCYSFTIGIFFAAGSFAHAYGLCEEKIKLSDRTLTTITGSVLGLMYLTTIYDMNHNHNKLFPNYFSVLISVASTIVVLFNKHIPLYCCSRCPD